MAEQIIQDEMNPASGFLNSFDRIIYCRVQWR